MNRWHQGLRARIQKFYDEVINVSVDRFALAPTVPSAFRRSQLNLCAFEATFFKQRLLGPMRPGQRILVIGDGGYGVDYFWLAAAECRVTVLDIAHQSAIPCLVIGDAGKALPFQDRVFDAAIAADILEHLVDDATCLHELRRVLTDDGKLLITVPFHHDRHPAHVRIHSPASIRRLLAATGFSTLRLVERGGFINFERFPPYVWIKHSLNAIAFLATGRTFYRAWNRVLATVDWWAGTHAPITIRHAVYWGGVVVAAKGAQTDFPALNREIFRTKC